MLNPNYLFLENNKDQYRIFALQGGTRSGKTYAALHWIINQCYNYTGLTISIVRQTLPALRASVFRDFMEILKGIGLWEERRHNKTHNEYDLWGNRIEFFSLDEEQKTRGRKRDVLFVNEANEISYDKWRQLMNRTGGKAIIDYNPSDEQGWIYDHVLTRPDCGTLVTTYLDNPHLEKTLVAEIEHYKKTDEQYWRVYGLGQRGAKVSTVFAHWQTYDPTLNPAPDTRDIAYGLDFGYNVPTALVKCTFHSDKQTVWVEELLYRTHMTNNDLLAWLKQSGIPANALIYADAAEPDRIEELYRAGYRGCRPADKDVGAGIGRVKSTHLYISSHSTNLTQELNRYKWQLDKNNAVLDTPIKANDHAIDAMRYAIHTHQLKRGGKYMLVKN